MRKTPLLLAMMIIATGQVGVSIYLPSLPLIGHDLNLPQPSIQSLVTLFLVGFGVSQLFYGPLSDAIGRRPVFILGQSICFIGTVICIVFGDNISALEAGRLLQGLGAGSASVLGRSVLRDSYDGMQLTKLCRISLSLLLSCRLSRLFLADGLRTTLAGKRYLSLCCFTCWRYLSLATWFCQKRCRIQNASLR